MDGSFACPECGTDVEVHGLAPGRQVRCDFCQRLLEVPYLPRAADPAWKRQRFRRPKWARWALAALGIAAVLIVLAGAVRFFKKHHDSTQKRSINRLLEASRQHEDSGDLNQALIELDAALDLARHAGWAGSGPLVDHQKKRRALAQRDVETTLDRLAGDQRSTFPLGDWLNLITRLPRDSDLESFIAPVNNKFQAALMREVDSQLSAANQSFAAGQAIESFRRCERIAGLIKHLAPEAESAARSAAEKLVTQLVSKYGLTIQPPQGKFVFGTQSSYVSELMPFLVDAVEAKGYLPDRATSLWHDLWTHALYQVRLDVTERLDESHFYMSSQNRLTSIEARLSLLSRDVVLWKISPTVQTSVPIPKLSTYVSSRLAASPSRSEEIEKILYANARGQIEDRVRHNVANMPACPKPVKDE
jgi:hypothetical protein